MNQNVLSANASAEAHRLHTLTEQNIHKLGMSHAAAFQAAKDHLSVAQFFTPNGTIDTSKIGSAMTPDQRALVMVSLIRVRMRETGETYDEAWRNCIKDPANAKLVGAMNEPADLTSHREMVERVERSGKTYPGRFF